MPYNGGKVGPVLGRLRPARAHQPRVGGRQPQRQHGPAAAEHDAVQDAGGVEAAVRPLASSQLPYWRAGSERVAGASKSQASQGVLADVGTQVSRAGGPVALPQHENKQACSVGVICTTPGTAAEACRCFSHEARASSRPAMGAPRVRPTGNAVGVDVRLWRHVALGP